MHRNGVFAYGGPAVMEGSEEMRFDLRHGGLTEIRTSPDSVAPVEAEANVDLKDPRITVVKHEKKPGYWASGPWASSIEGGEVLGWHKTKKDGVEDIARRLAISDWHEKEEA
jgi:hypothetical protein